MGVRIDMGSAEGQKAACNLCNNMTQRPLIFELMASKRSLNQNDMINGLYRQLQQQIEDQSFNDIRYECKLTIGVPILRRDSEKFRSFYNAGLLDLTYEQKLVAMEYLDVTSLFNKTQGGEFIDEVIKKYSMQGYSLLHPSEEGKSNEST
jgi:hypothetical protein